LHVIIFLLFIGLLAILQITIINQYPIGGVKLNLVLIGLLANIFNPHFGMVVLGAVVGGLIYDFSGTFNFISLISFLVTIIILHLWSKKYLVKKNMLLIFSLVPLEQYFSIFYVLLSYFLFMQTFSITFKFEACCGNIT